MSGRGLCHHRAQKCLFGWVRALRRDRYVAARSSPDLELSVTAQACGNTPPGTPTETCSTAVSPCMAQANSTAHSWLCVLCCQGSQMRFTRQRDRTQTAARLPARPGASCASSDPTTKPTVRTGSVSLPRAERSCAVLVHSIDIPLATHIC